MKILIISLHIFPIQTPRSNRTTELVKEFSRSGHKVTVYSVLGDYNYKSFEENYKVKVKNIPVKTQIRPFNSDGIFSRNLLDKILSRVFGKILEFPYIEFMYSIPRIIKQEEQVDLLISIGDPHHIHWGCAKAKKKYPTLFPKKWIADCGDPFMANGTTKYHLHFFAKYEKKFCKLCDYITVPHEKAIEGYYPEFRKKIRVIPQGFEFNITKNINNFKENEVVTFAFAGVFLKDIRNPTLFLDYLAELDCDFKFIVYTSYQELIIPYRKILGDKLEIKEVVNRKKLMLILESMDFLLNIENVNMPTAIPSKLIDYAIIGRPILSVNPEKINKDDINDFLRKDYSKRFLVKDIEQYHISNVVKKFIDLTI